MDQLSPRPRPALTWDEINQMMNQGRGQADLSGSYPTGPSSEQGPLDRLMEWWRTGSDPNNGISGTEPRQFPLHGSGGNPQSNDANSLFSSWEDLARHARRVFFGPGNPDKDFDMRPETSPHSNNPAYSVSDAPQYGNMYVDPVTGELPDYWTLGRLNPDTTARDLSSRVNTDREPTLDGTTRTPLEPQGDNRTVSPLEQFFNNRTVTPLQQLGPVRMATPTNSGGGPTTLSTPMMDPLPPTMYKSDSASNPLPNRVPIAEIMRIADGLPEVDRMRFLTNIRNHMQSTGATVDDDLPSDRVIASLWAPGRPIGPILEDAGYTHYTGPFGNPVPTATPTPENAQSLLDQMSDDTARIQNEQMDSLPPTGSI